MKELIELLEQIRGMLIELKARVERLELNEKDFAGIEKFLDETREKFGDINKKVSEK